MDAMPAVNDASKKESSPLLTSAGDRNYTKELLVSKEDLLTSDTHKAKDFQLIHVPKGAVSF